MIKTGKIYLDETANLVTGSDGTFSRVRPLLTSTDISYSGLTMMESVLFRERANTNPQQII
ncbi:hypothetical protein [Brevibacillus fulvus]|uniref:Uncharacterized protein n=1 Tax=Brevibacillus fulvus TaxID=1125967 RepID=A0A938XWT9_9BACL|nr:hypothetical protein [Brevibacillus fulvus]MBM7589108.1 hypothetical protein [Brevibacillus fulvus]